MSVNKDIISVPAVEDEIAEESLYSDNSKLRLTDAVEYYKSLLAENNLIVSECSALISHEAMLIGEKIYKNTVDMLAENIIMSDEELIHANEVCEEVFLEQVEADASSDEYEPEEKKKKKN